MKAGEVFALGIIITSILFILSGAFACKAVIEYGKNLVRTEAINAEVGDYQCDPTTGSRRFVWKTGIQKIEKSAIEAGVAEYRCDPNTGETILVWKKFEVEK